MISRRATRLAVPPTTNDDTSKNDKNNNDNTTTNDTNDYNNTTNHDTTDNSHRWNREPPTQPPQTFSKLREFKDVVFEDVVFDNSRCYLILHLYFT